MKRRSQDDGDIFGLSFMDCICCGFGAVILLFVMTTQFESDIQEEVEARVQNIVVSSEEELAKKQAELDAVMAQIQSLNEDVDVTTNAMERTDERIEQALEKIARKNQVERDKVRQIAQLKIDLNRALKDLEATKQLQKQKGDPSNAVMESPGGVREHYLTGLKVNGERSVILIDGSLSMLANNLQSVIPYRAASPADKLKSRKWVRTLDTFDWLMATIESQQFQAFIYNDRCEPLVPGSQGQWLDAQDSALINEASSVLWRTPPTGGSDLESAFQMAMSMKPQPTHIYLITDGLPTKSSLGSGGNVTSKERARHYKKAQSVVINSQVSVNTILFPFMGDPQAAYYYWNLASRTKGSVFKPTPDWPN